MKRFSVLIIILSLLIGALAACLPGDSGVVITPTNDEKSAIEALTTFFDLLLLGEYTEAAAYYGGSYQVLTDKNPQVDPTDIATLWRNGCSINGFNCLKVLNYSLPEQVGPGEFVFDVQFSTREGEMFVIGACCGGAETLQPPVSEFTIRVTQGEDGRFRVMDLPPYTP
jgi:hypothetical protein